MRFPVVVFAAMIVGMLALPAAADVAGKYSVQGRDPGGGQDYQGEVAVRKEGTTYHVMWSIGRSVTIGTGILTENTFAVTYVLVGGRGVPGVAVYEVADDGTLSGTFTMLGAGIVGAETWKPISP